MSVLGNVDNQIMWNRLIAVVEEQATTLIRTAFSLRYARPEICLPVSMTGAGG